MLETLLLLLSFVCHSNARVCSNGKNVLLFFFVNVDGKKCQIKYTQWKKSILTQRKCAHIYYTTGFQSMALDVCAFYLAIRCVYLILAVISVDVIFKSKQNWFKMGDNKPTKYGPNDMRSVIHRKQSIGKNATSNMNEEIKSRWICLLNGLDATLLAVDINDSSL